jgi:bis(5'-nucleosidyl)-tetraphosphatase
MMIKTQSAGGIIVNEFSEVAIVYTNTKSWQFPKGGIESGESHLETAVREIEEETGLKNLELIKQLPMYSRISAHTTDVCLELFYFLFKAPKQKLTPSAEITDCKWVPINKVHNELTYPEDKKFIIGVKQNILDAITF